MEPSVSAVLILVVEDEPLLQDMLCATLEEAGFAVAKSSNGENAIRMLDAPDAGFRALLTDVNLDPGKLTGWDVARHARQINSELPVVYMSGADGHAWSSEGVPNSIYADQTLRQRPSRDCDFTTPKHGHGTFERNSTYLLMEEIQRSRGSRRPFNLCRHRVIAFRGYREASLGALTVRG